jgi:GNAT superfamily N-acetyltransferase
MQRVIDLKEHASYVAQYVDLRNRYVDLLLTNPVHVEETRTWLARDGIEVRCLVDRDVLIGCVILYLNRGGEVALFVKERGKGLATPLLHAVEEVARNKGRDDIWAWVLLGNEPAKRAFLKAGYVLDATTEKVHKGIVRKGYLLRRHCPPADLRSDSVSSRP